MSAAAAILRFLTPRLLTAALAFTLIGVTQLERARHLDADRAAFARARLALEAAPGELTSPSDAGTVGPRPIGGTDQRPCSDTRRDD